MQVVIFDNFVLLVIKGYMYKQTSADKGFLGNSFRNLHKI